MFGRPYNQVASSQVCIQQACMAGGLYADAD